MVANHAAFDVVDDGTSGSYGSCYGSCDDSCGNAATMNITCITCPDEKTCCSALRCADRRKRRKAAVLDCWLRLQYLEHQYVWLRPDSLPNPETDREKVEYITTAIVVLGTDRPY